MRYRLPFLLFASLILAMASCIPGPCPEYDFKIYEVTLKTYDRPSDSGSFTLPLDFPEYEAGTIIDNLIIEITTELMEYELKDYSVYAIDWSKFSIIQSAYAFQPCDKPPLRVVSSFSVVSNSDFNENSPQGTDLAQYFSINDSLNNSYGSTRETFFWNTLLVINTLPELDGSHSFLIKINFENGDVYELSTPTITFY